VRRAPGNPSSIVTPEAGMSFVRSVRPSNLVILAALPFIVYLFASSADYQRSLRAILGVELGSGAFVPGFLLLAVRLFRRLCGARPVAE
jgi:polar amino acid transport system permease protein